MDEGLPKPLNHHPVLFVDSEDRGIRYKIGRYVQRYNVRRKRNKKHFQALSEKKALPSRASALANSSSPSTTINAHNRLSSSLWRFQL